MDVKPRKGADVFRRRREAQDATDQADPEGLDDLLSDDEVAAGQAVADDTGDDSDEFADDSDDGDETPVSKASAAEPYAITVPGRPQGPWDSHDVPRDDEVPRVDLGGILVPVPEGMEVRVEVQEETPVAATLVDGSSQLQVHAFAAPKSSGLWAEVRAEIATSLQGSGGSAEDVEGPFGTELRARIPQETGTQTARFIGVDGPRWFLRGLLTGPGSTDPKQAARLESAFRDIVVQRGIDAMAPRDMLPLHLPRDAQEVPQLPPPPDRSLQLPERGPEITEIQ
jgi:hypothetical protein